MVVASIYVNPTQFSVNEDFGVYPRSMVRAPGHRLWQGLCSGCGCGGCTLPQPSCCRFCSVQSLATVVVLCCAPQEDDLRRLEAAGCDAVFAPKTLYHAPSSAGADGGMVVGADDGGNPDCHETWVALERLSQGLCAKSRPHFFRGVCTVRMGVGSTGGGCLCKGLCGSRAAFLFE